MSEMIKRLVMNKVQQITASELVHYSKRYNFNITLQEAKQLTDYMQRTQPNPFNAIDRRKMYHEISRVTNRKTAEKAQQLLFTIVKEYGLEHLFD